MVMFRRVQMNARILVAVGLLLLGVLYVGAQATVVHAATTNTANTLKVSPVRTDVEINPGESKVVKTTVTNLTDAAIVVSPIENDFIAGDERGTPALILDATKFAPTHSLKRFMAPLPNVTIPAKKAQIVEVTITVPKNAQAGGYFGALRFAPASPDGGGQVNLSASVASLILLRVSGPTTEKLELGYFDIQQNGVSGSTFANPNNLQVAFRLQNKGNVQAGPFGKISVKSGDKVVYDADFNNKDPHDMILPDSARRWEVPLKNIGTFGKYTVNAVFTYGDKNQTIDVTKSFWVIPRSYVIMAIVGALLLIGVAVGSWLLIRRRHLRRRRSPYGRFR